MTTTINSTALDFTAIKNNLKTYLAAKDEFADYNFEASGLSNILDVLATNTHFNALTANFALNESFLSTAQLRSSVVSLAQGIGYIPRSKVSAVATVRLTLSVGSLAERPSRLTLPPGTKFTSIIDNKTYTFQTRETIAAIDNGTGFYRFNTLAGEENISIYEGTLKTKNFYVGDSSLNTVYIIPDKNIDTVTAVVKVYESAASTNFLTYTNIKDSTSINEESTIFIIKESPNGYYELTFSDGQTLGKAPIAGNKIQLEYLSTSGEEGNLAKSFRAVNNVPVGDGNFTLNVTTISESVSGEDIEPIESIRKNAPFLYASQNRMVTAVDYSSLILKSFGHLIKDIKCWGGEDAKYPEYGVVFISVVFNDDVPAEIETVTRQAIIELVEQLSVVSFDVKFDDPIFTYVEGSIYFQYNPKLTTLSSNSVRQLVIDAVDNYFDTAIGKYDKSFRRSNLLTDIDNVSAAVLSSRADIRLQQRFVPNLLGFTDTLIVYPCPLAIPDDINYIIRSNSFTYLQRTVEIRNKLGSNILQVVDVSTKDIIVDNVGSYNSALGTIDIIGLRVNQILSGDEFIKISAVPANQSAVSPIRNDILKYDPQATSINTVVVSST